MRPLIAILLLCAIPASARGGHGGGHSSYGGRSYGSGSYSSRSYTPRTYSSRSYSSSSKPVHVGTYTRSNGTTVHSYSRSYAGTAPRRTDQPRTYIASRSNTYRASTPRRTSRSYRAPRSTPRSTRHAEKKRSIAAKDAFKRQQPCPSTGRSSGRCPGYVVDHRIALACGGADDPSNMQWQTTTAARLKDKTERQGCR